MFFLAMALIALGGAGFYAASPHQRWRGAPLPAGPTRGLGALLLLAALMLLLRVMQPAAAVFTHLSWLMLWLTVWPCVGAFAARADRRPAP